MKRFSKLFLLFIFVSIVTFIYVPPRGDRGEGNFHGTHLYANENNNLKKTATDEKRIESDSGDTLLKVMAVILIVWIGLAMFLFRLDRKISGLEKDFKNLNG